MSLNIKLETFEGPLDLLLHLIEKNKMDIHEISISLITNQYMEYLGAMQEAGMDVMSEFLVMAATLLDIKCRSLLPREKVEDEDREDELSELVKQLLEHKIYQFMASDLKVMQSEAMRSLFKEETLPEDIKDARPPVDYNVLFGGATLASLKRIYNEIMRRQEDKVDPIRSKFGKIEKEEISIEEREKEILAFAKQRDSFIFQELIKDSKNRLEIIVTFLCVLEIAKNGGFIIEEGEKGQIGEIRVLRK